MNEWIGGRAPLREATISADAVHYGGLLEYDVHNLHSYMETVATANAMENIRGKRAFILSRSSFAGAGSRGAHWTGKTSHHHTIFYTCIV